jgi:hypothetical protein
MLAGRGGKKVNLLDYAANVTSQYGEDGILAQVFATIPPPAAGPRWCVDVGAGDGIEFSNTRQLILPPQLNGQAWHSIQIEADKARARDLRCLYVANGNVAVVETAVGWGPSDSLDAILARCDPPPPLEFDFLSIDVDGNELAIWHAVGQYRPRVVCVEFNPSWPPWISAPQAADQNVNKGAPLFDTVAIGRNKGYELVCATDLNAIFVTAELYPLFGIAENRPEWLWWHPEYWTVVGEDYDGTLTPAGRLVQNGHGTPLAMFWHASSLTTDQWHRQIQVAPEAARVWGGRPNREL